MPQRAIEGGGSSGRAAQMVGEYKEKVEGELKDICAEVLVRLAGGRQEAKKWGLQN